ncbi:hypothetical protein PANT111_40095 [Pantoea brenneri]|uniref:Uncharacterized protein n=1 Tax=Pantoea brenneri TaxID=472694 RepID=A0AAX3JA98_9GAMM|nr:hypothetical protein PANT111_40095 [Pantoea brenneri]
MATSRSTPAAGVRPRIHWPQKAVAAEDARVAVGCVHAHFRHGGYVPAGSTRRANQSTVIHQIQG